MESQKDERIQKSEEGQKARERERKVREGEKERMRKRKREPRKSE